MNDSVFKQNINQGILAHWEWNANLKNAVETGKFEYDVSSIAECDGCKLGSWLKSLREKDEHIVHSDHYKKVYDLHVKFHRVAFETALHVLEGRRREAMQSVDSGGPFAEASSFLINALGEWKESATE